LGGAGVSGFIEIHEHYNGMDIDIEERPDSGFIVDIKHPCGELEKGLWGVEKLHTAMQWAKSYIDKNTFKHECDNEYCESKTNE
jgi:hypothetical protein